jgi:hypothetical protein
MHNLHSERALRTAIKAATTGVASGKEHDQMWLRPFSWSFKHAKGNVGPIAEYPAAYGATVAPRRKAQVEQWSWGEQDTYDEVEEARRKPAEALAERGAAVMQKHGR